jgi:hypothetical protein
MLVQVLAGIVWLVWLFSGTAGLKDGLTVGAFLVLGFGVKNLLDTFWKGKHSDEKAAPKHTSELGQRSKVPPLKRESLPSPNWNVSRFEDLDNPLDPHRFGRR